MTLSSIPGLAAGVAAAGLVAFSAQAAPHHLSHPDLTGYWLVDQSVDKLVTLDGKTPPLKADAEKIYAENLAARARGDLSFDTTAKCMMPGTPRVMYLPYPIEFVQAPNQLLMLFAWNRLSRIVEMDGGTNHADYPFKQGAATGHWKGPNLVVSTVDIADGTWLDASGLPHSGDLKTIEVFTLSPDGKHLTDLISIEDPQTFTHQWQTKVTYHKLPEDYTFTEDSCLDRIQAGQPAVKAQP